MIVVLVGFYKWIKPETDNWISLINKPISITNANEITGWSLAKDLILLLLMLSLIIIIVIVNIKSFNARIYFTYMVIIVRFWLWPSRII